MQCQDCGIVAADVRILCRFPATLCTSCGKKRAAELDQQAIAESEAAAEAPQAELPADQTGQPAEPSAPIEPSDQPPSKAARRAARKAEGKAAFDDFKREIPLLAGLVRRDALSNRITYAGQQAKALWVAYLQSWKYALTGGRNLSSDYWELLAQIGGSIGGDMDNSDCRGPWIEATKACHHLDRIKNTINPTLAEHNQQSIAAAMMSLIRCSEAITTSSKRLSRSITRRTNAALNVVHQQDPYDMPEELQELWNAWHANQVLAEATAEATAEDDWHPDDRVELAAG